MRRGALKMRVSTMLLFFLLWVVIVCDGVALFFRSMWTSLKGLGVLDGSHVDVFLLSWRFGLGTWV